MRKLSTTSTVQVAPIASPNGSRRVMLVMTVLENAGGVAMENRDRATGRYAHTIDAACVCGHPLSVHTAASVGGARPCIVDANGGSHGPGCGCERFRKSRRATTPVSPRGDADEPR